MEIIKKNPLRGKETFFICDTEGGQGGWGLGVKSWPADIIPVVQTFTLWFFIAIWGDVFFLSIILTPNPLGLIADTCGPQELISR